MSDKQLTILLFAIVLGPLAVKTLLGVPHFLRVMRGRYHVWRFFKSQSKGVIAGFGLALNGVPVMASNEPVVFDSPKEAEEYAEKRNFNRINAITRKPNNVKVIYQEWNLDSLQMTWSEVRYGGR